MNRLIEAMLANRGYTDEFLRDIDTHDHLLPKNIGDMCERLDHYRKTGERITLLTDFDMDGIMCGVLGFAGLAEMGFNASLYLPETDSYGFDPYDIDRILETYPDTKAILTADVGISAYEGVAYGMDRGIEMLVTDHHKAPVAPACGTYVDPIMDEGEGYFGHICGAHTLYLVLRHYAEHFHPEPTRVVPQIERLRVFAGFGTVSDAMPVFYENRVLIRDMVSICRLMYADGLQDIVDMLPGCDIYRRAFLGLFTMLRMFQERGKFRDTTGIDETFVGFYVAPAFNSIKRMRGDIADAFNVFFGGKETAEACMEHIFDLTEQRKELVARGFAEMLDSDAYQPWAPYIYLTDIPGGVRGLLAQKVMSLTGEPVLVVGYAPDGSLVGSGRCPSWFPFLDASVGLEHVHPSGHNPAFGVSLDSDADCDGLVRFLKDEIAVRKPADASAIARPDFTISTVDGTADTGIDLELFEEFLSEIEMYRPFGSGFPAPEAELEFRPGEAAWTYLGRDKSHVKAILPHGLTLLCFNQAALFPGDFREDMMPSVTRVRGKLNINEFNGVRTVQFLGSLGDDMDQSGLPPLDGTGVDASDVIEFGGKGGSHAEAR